MWGGDKVARCAGKVGEYARCAGKVGEYSTM